eukprot:6484517-Amphidinium_carterae.1
MPDLHGLYTDDLVNEEVFVRASSEEQRKSLGNTPTHHKKVGRDRQQKFYQVAVQMATFYKAACILSSILLPADKHRNTSDKWGKYNFLDTFLAGAVRVAVFTAAWRRCKSASHNS